MFEAKIMNGMSKNTKKQNVSCLYTSVHHRCTAN